MSHEILDEKFYSYRQVPWHGLGIVSDQLESPSSVFSKIHYNIRKVGLLTEEGQSIPYFALLNDQGKILDVVSKEFQFFTPEEFARALDSLGLPVETMGVLREGRTLFTTIKLDPFEVLDDEMQNYLVLTSNWAGALRIFWTPIRVVCMNTMRLAFRKKKDAVSITHRSRNPLEIFQQEAERMIRKVMDWQVQQQQQLQQWSIPVSEPVAQQMLQEIYPLYEDYNPRREKEFLSLNKQLQERQNLALELFRGAMTGFSATNQGTAWALFQSVVELENYYPSRKEDSRVYNLLDGERGIRIEKAFSVVSNYVATA